MNSILQAIISTIQTQNTGGIPWPDDAVFAVKYNMSTWPIGWGKEASVKFFPSEAELLEWMDSMQKWSRLEDNYAAWSVFEWNLGPNLRMDLDNKVSNVGYTYEEYHAAGTIRRI
jgi:hypothetical protein